MLASALGFSLRWPTVAVVLLSSLWACSSTKKNEGAGGAGGLAGAAASGGAGGSATGGSSGGPAGGSAGAAGGAATGGGAGAGGDAGAGVVSTLTQANAQLDRLALGADDVFYTSSAGQFLARVSKLGKAAGNPADTWKASAGAPYDVLVQNAFVYVADSSRILKNPESQPLAPTIWVQGQGTPSVIASDALYLYFDTCDISQSSIADLKRVALNGAGSSSDLVAASVPCSVWHMAVDAQYLWVTTDAGVFRIPKGASTDTATAFALAGKETRGLALSTKFVFVATRDTSASLASEIHQLDGSGSVKVLQGGFSNVTAMAADATHLYFTTGGTAGADFADGAVWRLNHVTGGTADVLAQGQQRPLDIAVDANAVYWVNAGSLNGASTPTVMKRTK